MCLFHRDSKHFCIMRIQIETVWKCNQSTVKCSSPGGWGQLMLPKNIDPVEQGLLQIVCVVELQFQRLCYHLPFSLNWPCHFDGAAFMAAQFTITSTTFFRDPDVLGPPQTICIDQKRHLISLHCFFFLSRPWKMVLIDIRREKKQVHVWRNAVIFKDKPGTVSRKGKSPLLLTPRLLGPQGFLSSPMGIQQPPDDILNIIASPGWICLFCVYIWSTERTGLAKLFIALELRR